MFRFARTSLLITVAAITGCGKATSDPGPSFIPVSGTLTLDGQPLPFKSVRLSPTDGTAGRGAAGYSDPEGRFHLVAVVSDKLNDIAGCPPGHYRVIVNEPMIPISEADFETGNQTSATPTVEPAVAILLPDPNAKSDIPAVYRSDNTSPLEVEIREENTTLTVELQSKPSPSPSPADAVQHDT